MISFICKGIVVPTDGANCVFFNRTGLELVGVVGLEPRLLWTGLKALDRQAGDRAAAGLIYRLCAWLFSAKRTRKKKGWQGLRPWLL